MRLIDKKLWQRGDTIIEVMIVLAVLGLAISISYSTASRSLLNARQAQESAEAAKLAQSQIERLFAQKDVVPDPVSGAVDATHYIYDDTRLFCMGDDGRVRTGFLGGSLNQSTLVAANYPADCVRGLYDISVRYEPTQYDRFTVRVAWDDVLGNGRDTVTLVYRIHKPVDVP